MTPTSTKGAELAPSGVVPETHRRRYPFVVVFSSRPPPRWGILALTCLVCFCFDCAVGGASSLKTVGASRPCTSEADYQFQIVRRAEGNARICLELVDEAAEWSSANQTCVNRGGHLARPLSHNDTKIIEIMLNSHPVSRDYWIDANDMNKEGEWRWSDGVAVHYVNWRKGRPINSSRHFSRDCAELHRNFEWKWNDKDCVDNKNFFICQYAVHDDDDNNNDGAPTLDPPLNIVSTPSSSTSSSSSSITPNGSSLTSRPTSTTTLFSTTTTTTLSTTTLSTTTTTISQSNPGSFTTETATTKSAISPFVSLSPRATMEPSAHERDDDDYDDDVDNEMDRPVDRSCPSSSDVASPSSTSGGGEKDAVFFFSPSQIALLVICIVAVLLMAFFAFLVALPCLRRKLKIPGSSPSSPSSSSIESPTDSSLNSSSSSSDPHRWTAVLKCFSNQPFQHHNHRNNPYQHHLDDAAQSQQQPDHHLHHQDLQRPRRFLPTFTLTNASPHPPPPPPPADVAADAVRADAIASQDVNVASPTVDFLRVHRQLPVSSTGNAKNARSSSNAAPDLLPDVDVSPQLPTFNIKRKPGGGGADDDNADSADSSPPRRPRWRLSFGSRNGGSTSSSICATNPAFMADIRPLDNAAGTLPEKKDADDDDDGRLRADTPPPAGLNLSRLELDLGDPTVAEHSHPEVTSSQPEIAPSTRVPTRNVFMKDALGVLPQLSRGDKNAGNSFQYEKF